MTNKVSLIVIDTGFNAESLAGARVLAFIDLVLGRTACGDIFLPESMLATFAGDPVGHGSEVLSRLRALAPRAPLILIRAFSGGDEASLIRTAWKDGAQSAPGWTEAYLAAVALCNQRGLPSVANCSFGTFAHACDGSGWESFQLSRVTGAGKPGHVVVAAAGPGDGRAVHTSFLLPTGDSCSVRLFQKETTSYNLWSGLAGVNRAEQPRGDQQEADWQLEVHSEFSPVAFFDGRQVPLNIWNGRRQHNFTIYGAGHFELRLKRSAQSRQLENLRFDCWAATGDGGAFFNHVDPVLIAEPAIYPHVISVGLRGGQYSPRQEELGEKPDVLLNGSGMVSFRLPEVTFAAAKLIAENPDLDVIAIKRVLGKVAGLRKPATGKQ